jgi:hypothetical protein
VREIRGAVPPGVAALDTLEDVIAWGLAQHPACDVVEVIVQDEFTHDVICARAGEEIDNGPRFLVFDTT